MYSSDTVMELYELEHQGFIDDLHLYRSYAMLSGGPVLELGCGTARLMLPLATLGYDVVGVDSSASMLARARQKLEASGLRSFSLVEAPLPDLTALPEAHFGLTFCALNTWAHLTDPVDALATLEAVHRVLRPAGLLIIDMEDSERRAPGRGELLLGGVFDGGGERVTKLVSSSMDPVSGVEQVTIFWDRLRAGVVHRTMTQAEMRYWSRGEMEQMLQRAGFAVQELLGSWDLEEYAGRGDRLIFVATRL
ncbi:MAG: methyltransferase domain-containing protein [Chloroflexia bacterium]|nr:methyltransferase domain-containing protein [Chloroflexia bacterium]